MTTAQPTVTTWAIDKVHSHVGFSVKHMMISTVRGRFRDYGADIYIDEARPGNSRVEAWAGVTSIDTGEPDRDNHLRSDDFFNAERFPRITFVSKRVEPRGDHDFAVIGDLTIRDVTKEVEFEGEFEGPITDPWGNRRVGFSLEGEISRKEFGVRWNQALETGGWVVGDKVKINAHIEATRQL